MVTVAACSVGTIDAATVACSAPAVPSPTQPLTLEAALARVDCHPLVRTARAALQAARADEITAGQRPNAQLSLGAYSVARGGVGAGRLMDKTFDHQARLDQMVERGRKRELRLEAAARGADAAVADLGQARADARADVASAFLDRQAAQARLQALRDFVELSRQSMALVRARVQAGDAPAMDLARLQVEDARLQAERSQAQADMAAASARLAVALGLDAGVGAVSMATSQTMNFAALPADEAASLEAVARLVDGRAEVRAAVARSEAGERRMRLAAAQRIRDVSVGIQADRYPASIANPSGTGNTASFSVSVPLFTAHAYEGEIARALADWHALQDQEAQVREAARALVEQTLEQARVAQARQALAQAELAPAARRLAEAAEAAYAKGGIGMLELLEARRALRVALLEHLTLQAEAAKSLWRWQALHTEP